MAQAEITIPTTSLYTPTDNSKPYTLYNITFQLPLRTYVLQKRYSEFDALHTLLTSLVGSPPPAPLPAKSWFRSTLKSPEMTETRRRGLEAYLQAIAGSPDRRWRDTPAWRAFLNLPPISSSAASANGGYGIPNRDAANAAAAQDPGTWLDLHGEMKRDFQEARRCLARRDAATEHSIALEAGSAAKKALVKAGGLLNHLRDGLQAMEEARRLGDGEIRRRKDLLGAARVDREDLEKLSSTISSSASAKAGPGGRGGGVPSATDKAALLGNAASASASHRTTHRGRVLGAPLPETEQTRELDNAGVAQLQRTLMREQDQDVEALGKIIRRQREIAMAIERETAEHNDMLNHIDNQVEVTSGKVKVASNRTKKLANR